MSGSRAVRGAEGEEPAASPLAFERTQAALLIGHVDRRRPRRGARGLRRGGHGRLLAKPLDAGRLVDTIERWLGAER